MSGNLSNVDKYVTNNSPPTLIFILVFSLTSLPLSLALLPPDLLLPEPLPPEPLPPELQPPGLLSSIFRELRSGDRGDANCKIDFAVTIVRESEIEGNQPRLL